MVRETAFDGLKNGGGALAAGHSADFSGEHFFQRSARPLAGRSEHEGLTLFDPEQTQGAAAVVVGAAISRPCEAEQRLQAFLGFVAGRASGRTDRKSTRLNSSH